MSNNETDTWKESDKTWNDLRRERAQSAGYQCAVSECEATATHHSPTGSNRPVYCELHRHAGDDELADHLDAPWMKPNADD